MLNFDAPTIEKGIFKVNIHRSNPNTKSTWVNKWSAGCQVFSIKKEWDEFINLCDEKFKAHGQKFTYTLLNVEDIIQAAA